MNAVAGNGAVFAVPAPLVRSSPLARVPLGVQAFVLYTLFMLVNCYFTSNPYSANHAGRAGLETAEVISERWFISPAYGVMASALLALIMSLRAIRLDLSVCLIVVMLACSGLYNGAITDYPRTYLYDSIIFLLCSILASLDVSRPYGHNWLNSALGYTAFLLALGFALSTFRPDTYGHFGDFTRERRGELTLVSVTGVFPLLTAFGIAAYVGAKTWLNKSAALALVVLHLFLNLLYANRAAMISTVAAILIFAYVRSRTAAKRLVFAVALVSVILLWSGTAMQYVGLGYEITDARVLNGRAALWEAHWNAFLEAPWFGSGAGVLDRLNCEIGATSEIGALRWFSEYGIFFGIGMAAILFRGFLAAWQMASRQAQAQERPRILDLLCPQIVFASVLVNIFEGYSRLLTYDAFFYYYSLLYCCARVSWRTPLRSSTAARHRAGARPVPHPGICREPLVPSNGFHSDCRITPVSTTV
jgi:hypothetical protein